MDRLSKFIDPTVNHTPSTTNVLACRVVGCHSYTRTPDPSRVSYHARPASRTTLTSVRGPAVRIRTSTPRCAAAARRSMKLRAGAKYEFVMYSVLLAAAIDRAKN